MQKRKNMAFWNNIEGDKLTAEFYDPKFKKVEKEL